MTAFPVALMALFLCACLPPRSFDENAWRKRVERTRTDALYSPHRDDSGRFLNPWDPQERSFLAFLRWRLSVGAVGPGSPEDLSSPLLPNDGAYLVEADQPPSVTNVGHATFAIHWSGQVVLTDPVFSGRVVMVKRLVLPAFGAGKIPPGSVVLISHNHYDHLDSASVGALAGTSRFLCPLGLGDFLRTQGARDVRELDWWQSAEVDGTVFTCLPVQHWARRLGQGYNRSLWCSWLLERRGRKIYFGADSGYFKGFREFGRKYPGIDVALLGAGASEPRWFMHYAHMNIPEVLRAFQDLGAGTLVPIHWGVFKLGDEPAAMPARLLRQAVEADPELANRVVILPVGGRLMLDERPQVP